MTKRKILRVGKRVVRETLFWGLAISLAIFLFSKFAPTEQAGAIVQPNGRVYYGDSTNSGVLKFQTNSFDFTFNGEVSTAISTSSSLIKWLVAKTALTRDEVMIGHLKADGRLDVIKGVNGYDVAGDYSSAWSHANVSGAQTCEGTTSAELAATDCTRPFDISYERLSGRAMVVYAGDSQDGGTVTDDQKLFYCYFDGSSWAPVSNCAPTTGTNDLTLSSNGRPTAVSLKAKGGSNEILLGVGIDVAGTHEVEAYRWDGDSWEDQVVATDTTDASNKGLDKGMVFDVEWESLSGDALVIYATADTSNEIKYKLLPSGGSWGSETGAFDTNANGSLAYYVNADADPVSDRIAVAINDDANDFSGAVWKDDGSTTGWTVMATDASLEGSNGTASGPQYTDVVWEAFSSRVVFALVDLGASNQGDYILVSCTGSGCSISTSQSSITTTRVTDDNQSIRLAASRNSDDIMVLLTSIDRELVAQHWEGEINIWESGDALLESALSISSADRNSTYTMADMPFGFVYIPYSSWARNWKFWQGTDTTNTPTNQLAAENTAPTDFAGSSGKFRLRYSVAELSGMNQDDARKKLQYASGASCTPNTVEGDPDCTWTDVDNSGGSGIWRYTDCNGGDSSICDDNATLSGTTLSGSPTAGWWNQHKSDLINISNMDHSSLQLRELEYSIEANGAAASTTYYFRIYDFDQDKPVRREQDNDGSNDCVSAACTYPSLTTETPAGPTTDQVMRHGNWFSSGVEQGFFWANFAVAPSFGKIFVRRRADSSTK